MTADCYTKSWIQAVRTFYASLPHIKDDGWQRGSDRRVKKCRKKVSPLFLLPGNKELVVVQLDTAVLLLIHSYPVPKPPPPPYKYILCYLI